jgi:uncharacterized protein (DUF488 family)
MTERRPRLWTVGHGRVAQDAFVALLSAHGITALVDVRRHPGSRRNPQYGRGQLEGWLPAAGIAYRWEPGMGGHREPAPGSAHTAITDPALRAYADHMATAEFGTCLAALAAQAAAQPTAVMCAEGDWRRCHRRFLADAAVLLGAVDVGHLRPDGSVEAHLVTPAARVAGGAVGSPPARTLIYDGGQLTIAD